MVVMSQTCGAEKEPLPPGAEPAAAFTPGPWVVERSRSTFWIGPPKAASPSPVTGEPLVGDIVAEVEGGFGRDYRPDFIAKQTANARLIAAAPDLFDALEDLLAACGPDHQCGEWAWEERKNARDAIAAARGGSLKADTSSATDPLRDANT